MIAVLNIQTPLCSSIAPVHPTNWRLPFSLCLLLASLDPGHTLLHRVPRLLRWANSLQRKAKKGARTRTRTSNPTTHPQMRHLTTTTTAPSMVPFPAQQRLSFPTTQIPTPRGTAPLLTPNSNRPRRLPPAPSTLFSPRDTPRLPLTNLLHSPQLPHPYLPLNPVPFHSMHRPIPPYSPTPFLSRPGLLLTAEHWIPMARKTSSNLLMSMT